jgi:Integrase core domain
VQLDFIRPGKPVENAFIEAFKLEPGLPDRTVPSVSLPDPQLQCDNGHEFPFAFALAVQALGIRHRYIKPRRPQQNGKVERSHRIDQEEFWAAGDFADFSAATSVSGPEKPDTATSASLTCRGGRRPKSCRTCRRLQPRRTRCNAPQARGQLTRLNNFRKISAGLLSALYSRASGRSRSEPARTRSSEWPYDGRTKRGGTSSADRGCGRNMRCWRRSMQRARGGPTSTTGFYTRPATSWGAPWARPPTSRDQDHAPCETRCQFCNIWKTPNRLVSAGSGLAEVLVPSGRGRREAH